MYGPFGISWEGGSRSSVVHALSAVVNQDVVPSCPTAGVCVRCKGCSVVRRSNILYPWFETGHWIEI